MDIYFLIGYRQCKLNEILITVKYILNGRPITFTTDIADLAIDLFDRKDINNQSNYRGLFSN